MGYTHLTRVERYQIEALLSAGHLMNAIAEQLGRHKSTISRELKRNRSRDGYQAKKAQERYRELLQEKGWDRQPWHTVFEEVAVPLLKEGWSPEQISGTFKGSDYAVSHEWLYRRILEDKQSGGQVYRYLRCQMRRKKRYGKPDRREQM